MNAISLFRSFLLFALLAALCAGKAASAGADPRVRTEVYDPQKVYTVYTGIGIASLIQFEADESLEASPSSVLGIGDAKAWNLGVRGNNIVLKPAARMPKTNIVVVTNKRTYSLDLKPSSKRHPPTYVIRFHYPDTLAAEAEAELRRLDLTAASRAEQWRVNTDYIWKGEFSDALLAPTGAWDDGRFTRLIYDHAGELPVFYKVLPDGSEALLNYSVDPREKSTLLLHEVIRVLRARLNEKVIEIHNRGYRLPSLNRTGAGEHGATRRENRDE